jgi:hypothetical protein
VKGDVLMKNRDSVQLREILSMNQEEMMDRLFILREKCERIIFLIGEIADEGQKEVVDVYLDLLAIAKKEADAVMLYEDDVPLREHIRIGSGDYRRIQDKCIKMGLV